MTMWIQAFREKEGLELYELSRAIDIYRRMAEVPVYGVVTENVLHILESAGMSITCADFADAIAAVCRATREERNSIVPEDDADDEWAPDDDERMLAEIALHRVKAERDGGAVPYRQRGRNRNREIRLYRTVIKIDNDGVEIDRYQSVPLAAEDNGLEIEAVIRRCEGRVQGRDRLRKYGFGFRYAREDEENSKREGGEHGET